MSAAEGRANEGVVAGAGAAAKTRSHCANASSTETTGGQSMDMTAAGASFVPRASSPISCEVNAAQRMAQNDSILACAAHCCVEMASHSRSHAWRTRAALVSAAAAELKAPLLLLNVNCGSPPAGPLASSEK